MSANDLQVPSFTVGGLPFLWFQDLTVPDPYYALPTVSALIFLLAVELNLADGMDVRLLDTSTIQWHLSLVLRVNLNFSEWAFPYTLPCLKKRHPGRK